jgi:hypothetical protein
MQTSNPLAESYTNLKIYMGEKNGLSENMHLKLKRYFVADHAAIFNVQFLC